MEWKEIPTEPLILTEDSVVMIYDSMFDNYEIYFGKPTISRSTVDLDYTHYMMLRRPE